MPHVSRPDLPALDAEAPLDELVDALRRRLGGPLSMQAIETAPAAQDVYLPRSWLSRGYRRVRDRQGDTEHGTVTDWPRRRILVATLNRLDADVERVLGASDPRVEVATIYEGIRELDERWATSGETATPVGCGCRATYWSATLVGYDEQDRPLWEHRCAWCTATTTKPGAVPGD